MKTLLMKREIFLIITIITIFFIPNTWLYLEMNLRKIIIFPHIFLITTGYQNDKIK